MTAQEIMIMYARLWGIPETKINNYVKKSMEALNLESYADKYIYTYRWDIILMLSLQLILRSLLLILIFGISAHNLARVPLTNRSNDWEIIYCLASSGISAIKQTKLRVLDSWGRKESDTTERLNWTELVSQFSLAEMKHNPGSITNVVIEFIMNYKWKHLSLLFSVVLCLSRTMWNSLYWLGKYIVYISGNLKELW